MNEKQKFFLPTIITAVITFFLTIAADTWKFDGMTILANLITIGLFAGIAYFISCNKRDSKIYREKQKELIKKKKKKNVLKPKESNMKQNRQDLQK